jgi:hypothetical protein
MNKRRTIALGALSMLCWGIVFMATQTQASADPTPPPNPACVTCHGFK